MATPQMFNFGQAGGDINIYLYFFFICKYICKYFYKYIYSKTHTVQKPEAIIIMRTKENQ